MSGKSLGQIAVSVLDKGVPIRFLARGFSMYPYIRDRDVITICPLKDDTLSRGEVVAFILPESENLVVHRIIGVYDNNYRVKGDNMRRIDGVLPRTAILGIVKKVERHGKCVNFGPHPVNSIIPPFIYSKIQRVILKIRRRLPALFFSNRIGNRD